MTAVGSATGSPDASGPWLSILVPVRNAGDFLPACLESIRAQIDEGVELLLLDDASQDASAAVIDRFAAAGRVPRMSVFRHDAALGVSAARNALLAQARGEYIWFIDADDTLEPGAVAALRSLVRRDSPDLVLCDYRVLRPRVRLAHRLRGEGHRYTFAGSRRVPSCGRDALIAGALRAGQLHIWSKIARRSLWPADPFPVGRVYEDIPAAAALLARAERWVHVAAPWIAYRQHPRSLMAMMPPSRMPDLAASVGQLHRALMPCVASDDARFALDYYCVRAFASIARRLAPAPHPAVAVDCRAELKRLFPAGTRHVVRGCIQRGWLLRAWRIRRSLERMGWA